MTNRVVPKSLGKAAPQTLRGYLKELSDGGVAQDRPSMPTIKGYLTYDAKVSDREIPKGLEKAAPKTLRGYLKELSESGDLGERPSMPTIQGYLLYDARVSNRVVPKSLGKAAPKRQWRAKVKSAIKAGNNLAILISTIQNEWEEHGFDQDDVNMVDW